jgi:hypothetical protein
MTRKEFCHSSRVLDFSAGEKSAACLYHDFRATRQLAVFYLKIDALIIHTISWIFRGPTIIGGPGKIAPIRSSPFLPETGQSRKIGDLHPCPPGLQCLSNFHPDEFSPETNLEI